MEKDEDDEADDDEADDEDDEDDDDEGEEDDDDADSVAPDLNSLSIGCREVPSPCRLVASL